MLSRRRRGLAGDEHLDPAQAQIRRCVAAVYGWLVGEFARSGFRALRTDRRQALAGIAHRSWNASGGSLRPLQRQHQCGRAALAGRVSVRPSGRAPDELRELSFARGYTKHAEGAVLVGFGATRVLCTASVEDSVPSFLRGQAQGWVTAEYGMLPRATHTRSAREAARGKQRCCRPMAALERRPLPADSWPWRMPSTHCSRDVPSPRTRCTARWRPCPSASTAARPCSPWPPPGPRT